MRERSPYRSAPIKEAVIDLRVQLPEQTEVHQLVAVQQVLREDYPTIKKLFGVSARLEFNVDDVTHQADSQMEHIGFRLESPDGLYIIQVQTGGIGISRLRPYDRWEPFRDEALKAWQAYCEVVRPVAVNRIAVRYINRIDIPNTPNPDTGGVELADYLKFQPELPANLPHDLMSAFITQVQIPQPDIDCMLVVNSTLEDPPNDATISVVLDIDLFRKDTWEPSSGAIWEFLDELRTRKNEVFEASITDLTRSLINQ